MGEILTDVLPHEHAAIVGSLHSIGGLWHGAGPTFALWGIYHGVLLDIERLTADRLHPPAWFSWPLTLLLVINGWALFRAHDLGTYVEVLTAMYVPRGGATLTYGNRPTCSARLRSHHGDARASLSAGSER